MLVRTPFVPTCFWVWRIPLFWNQSLPVPLGDLPISINRVSAPDLRFLSSLTRDEILWMIKMILTTFMKMILQMKFILPSLLLILYTNSIMEFSHTRIHTSLMNYFLLMLTNTFICYLLFRTMWNWYIYHYIFTGFIVKSNFIDRI